jgi:hypothetical protein
MGKSKTLPLINADDADQKKIWISISAIFGNLGNSGNALFPVTFAPR